MCVRELDRQWFRQWLVACSAPSHCLNQYLIIVNWTPANLNLNRIIFIQENAFENVVCQNHGDHFVQGRCWGRNVPCKLSIPWLLMDSLTDSLCRQVINSHDIDYVWKIGACFLWDRQIHNSYPPTTRSEIVNKFTKKLSDWQGRWIFLVGGPILTE